MTKKLINYCRVSTDEQGVARNGLEAQKAAVAAFAANNGYVIIDVVEEVASGKLSQEARPVLDAAIQRALKEKAFLVVSKLDRLSRDASFILNLMNSKAKDSFIVAELGENVSPFMLHIYAVVAEQERAMISQRTKSALAQLKLKGVKLGNPNLVDRVDEDGQRKLSIESAARLGGAVLASKADEFAARMRPTIERMLQGSMSYRAIAEEFNGNGMATARGGKWSAATVSNMVQRWR